MRLLLAECTANCHPWETTFLPTRLIDVGTSSNDIPRLVQPIHGPTTVESKYAALSYCWGDEKDAETQLKTEKATLKQRLEGIPLEIMTPAVKDAVQLTRALGLRYIWIDALCIIQDDPRDWSYESGQMSRVFHGAFITFCGLNSRSCHEPFLQRAPAVTIPFQSTIRPVIEGAISIRLQPVSGDWRNREIYSIDRSTSRWETRAWTYQEEKLSTRLLLFGGSKMHFRCGTHRWSEGDDKLSRLYESSILPHDRIIGVRRGELAMSSLYATWNRLVHDYSSRSVTHLNDRLPAISGLAQLFYSMLGDHYVAGFWKTDTLTGLAWSGSQTSHGLQNHLQSIREREYIAPSWSWASCIGGGIMNTCVGWQTVFECTLLDIEVETDSQNPYGRVHGGYLRIRGNVAPIPARLRKRDWDDDWSGTWWLDVYEDDKEEYVVGWLDWLQRDKEEEGIKNLVMLLLHYQQPNQQSTRSHSHNLDTSDSMGQTQERVLWALLLYPTENTDEYYRVGSVHSRGQAGYKLMRSWFEDETNKRVCTII
jgi:hypothetical protein